MSTRSTNSIATPLAHSNAAFATLCPTDARALKTKLKLNNLRGKDMAYTVVLYIYMTKVHAARVSVKECFAMSSAYEDVVIKNMKDKICTTFKPYNDSAGNGPDSLYYGDSECGDQSSNLEAEYKRKNKFVVRRALDTLERRMEDNPDVFVNDFNVLFDASVLCSVLNKCPLNEFSAHQLTDMAATLTRIHLNRGVSAKFSQFLTGMLLNHVTKLFTDDPDHAIDLTGCDSPTEWRRVNGYIGAKITRALTCYDLITAFPALVFLDIPIQLFVREAPTILEALQGSSLSYPNIFSGDNLTLTFPERQKTSYTIVSDQTKVPTVDNLKERIDPATKKELQLRATRGDSSIDEVITNDDNLVFPTKRSFSTVNGEGNSVNDEDDSDNHDLRAKRRRLNNSSTAPSSFVVSVDNSVEVPNVTPSSKGKAPITDDDETAPNRSHRVPQDSDSDSDDSLVTGVKSLFLDDDESMTNADDVLELPDYDDDEAMEDNTPLHVYEAVLDEANRVAGIE